MAVTIVATGPLFDGSAAQVIENGLEEANAAVAQAAVDAVRARLSGVLRHPTGYAASRVVADVSIPDRASVNFGGLVYGPWLEGTSNRNDRSRFKGYRTFRIVAQELEDRVADIAGPVIAQHVEGLNA